MGLFEGASPGLQAGYRTRGIHLVGLRRLRGWEECLYHDCSTRSYQAQELRFSLFHRGGMLGFGALGGDGFSGALTHGIEAWFI